MLVSFWLVAPHCSAGRKQIVSENRKTQEEGPGHSSGPAGGGASGAGAPGAGPTTSSNRQPKQSREQRLLHLFATRPLVVAERAMKKIYGRQQRRSFSSSDGNRGGGGGRR